jgi:pantoate--beta-alanine ligase
MRKTLGNEPSVTAIQYAGLYDPFTLEEITQIEGEVLLAVAVKMGDTRLIDNMLVTMREER